MKKVWLQMPLNLENSSAVTSIWLHPLKRVPPLPWPPLLGPSSQSPGAAALALTLHVTAFLPSSSDVAPTTPPSISSPPSPADSEAGVAAVMKMYKKPQKRTVYFSKQNRQWILDLSVAILLQCVHVGINTNIHHFMYLCG